MADHPEPPYPTTAGFQDRDTSIAAAKAVTPKIGTLRERVLQALTERPRTSWELALALGLRFESVQPRTSELVALGLIEDSGKRGPSRDPTKLAIRWRVPERKPATPAVQLDLFAGRPHG